MSALEIQKEVESLPIEMQKTVEHFVGFLRSKLKNQNKSNGLPNNNSFDFLNEPEEDIYSLKDGKPFQKK